MIGTLDYPKQRLSYSKKISDDKKWGKEVIDYLLLNYATDSDVVNHYHSEYERKLSNYQLFNNQINQKDFERECNPLGIQVGQFKDEIQPYNKTYNKIQVLLGEELKRPWSYRTVLMNSEGVRSRQAHKTQKLKEFLQGKLQEFIQNAQAKFGGPEQGGQQSPTDGLLDPEKLDEYMKTSYFEAREKLANDILQYLIRKENLAEKKNDAFKHGLISGEEIVWVGVENGEPTVQVLNPLGVFYHKSPDTKYIEDGLYAGYRTFMTPGDILDKFGDFLTQDEIDRIEGQGRGAYGAHEDWIGKKMKYPNKGVYERWMEQNAIRSFNEGAYGKPQTEDWMVQHVEWKSQKKVGFIRYRNEYGDDQLDIVSEDYKVPPYAKKETNEDYYGAKRTVWTFDGKTLEWTWIPEVWEGVRIGDDIYCCIGPKRYQYRSLDNPKSCKLGYHGVVFNNMNAESISLMDRMKPFQYLYFIVAHKLKKLIATDRGKVFHFDITMVPEKLGLEKTLYYLEEMNIDFYNPLHNAETPGVHQRSKVTTATDRSNMQHILNYVQLLAALDEQISDVAGITRQREGQIARNEAVTNSQQTIMQSATITEAVYFQPHNKLWENVLNSLVQCAQSCWKNKSLIKNYVLDDLSIATLNISSGQLLNADIGVFVSNSARDNQLFEQIKMLAQPLIQNDKAKFSDIIELMKASSIEELSKKISTSEEKLEKMQQQQMEAQQQMQQEQLQAQQQAQQAEFQHEKELQAQKDAAAHEREIIKAMGFSMDKDVNQNEIPDVLEIEKFREQLNVDHRKLDLEEEKVRLDKEKMKSDEKLKREEMKSKERIESKKAQRPSSSSS